VPVELVTGEAVALDIRVARLASRALALFIDVVLQVMVLYFCMIFVQLSARVSDSAVTVGLAILVLVGVLIGYPTITETLTRGRTLGKLALGLRVVADDGGPERFRQALVRALAGFIEFWTLFGSPALIASLVSRRGKRLGDIFAGTIVIQDRVPVNVMLGPVAIMPPQLAPWAASLELSRLPDTIALAARQYLTRFWELAPRVRDEMGRRLTDEMMTYVSPPPPPGHRPEIYLSAVLAERRHREERRLAERAARRAAIARRGLPLAVSVPPGPAGPSVVAVGGPPPAPPAYGGGPMPVPEWLGGAPSSTDPPRFLPPAR
jgi:uncharacterized RDD family membrane protein YckC